MTHKSVSEWASRETPKFQPEPGEEPAGACARMSQTITRHPSETCRTLPVFHRNSTVTSLVLSVAEIIGSFLSRLCNFLSDGDGNKRRNKWSEKP